MEACACCWSWKAFLPCARCPRTVRPGRCGKTKGKLRAGWALCADGMPLERQSQLSPRVPPAARQCPRFAAYSSLFLVFIFGARNDFRTDRHRRLPVLSAGLRRQPCRHPDRSASAARSTVTWAWRPRTGLRIRYVLDTHTHADHFSAAKELGSSLDVPVVTQQAVARPLCRLPAGRWRDPAGRQHAAAGAAHARPHPRFHVHGGGGPRLHRRHAADRRHRPHRPAHRRSRRAV